jgi:hypothetical protein
MVSATIVSLGHAERTNSSRASLDRSAVYRPPVSQAYMGATRLACFCRKTGLFFLDSTQVCLRTLQWLIRTWRVAVNKEETWPLDLWMWLPYRAERPRSPCPCGQNNKAHPLESRTTTTTTVGVSHRHGQGEGCAIALWRHGPITNSSRLLLSTHHGFISSSSTVHTTGTRIDSPSDSDSPT